MSAAKELVEKDVAAERWTELLRQVAEGVPLEAACLAAGITSKEITVLTLSPLEAQRWADARLMAKRRRWPQLQLDDIFERFAAGMDVEPALTEVRGASDDVGEFYELMDTPDLADRYAAAQRARALRSAESLKAIADDDSKDTLSGPKGEIPNMAAVNRSRLRIETRQWLNGAWHERFSDKKGNVQVNVQINHAEVLEAARTRETLRDKAPARVTRRVIDAAFTSTQPVPAVEPQAAADHMRAVAVAACAEPAVVESEAADSFGFDD